MILRTEKEIFTVKVKRGKETGTFEIQPIDPEEREVSRKAYTEYERIHGQLMPNTDYFGLKIERVQKEIKGWDVKDINGKDIPCTDDNKRAAYILNSDIIDEALSKAVDMAGKAIVKKKATTKNS